MKPSERIKDIADGYVANYPEAIMFFLDEQAELLETHTVKEEKETLLGEDKSDGVHVKLFSYRKDGHTYIMREEVCENINCQCHQ